MTDYEYLTVEKLNVIDRLSELNAEMVQAELKLKALQQRWQERYWELQALNESLNESLNELNKQIVA